MLSGPVPNGSGDRGTHERADRQAAGKPDEPRIG
jgi:hypothetical protein